MNITKILAALLLAALMTTGARTLNAADASAFAGAEQRSSARAERESDLYEEGTDAIDDEEWEDAIDKFTQVAEMKGSRADGALYWTAYALNKLNRRTEALKTIDALEKNYPKSRWVNDAHALEVEINQRAGRKVDPQKYDDDTKVIAIQSLMHTDPEKAYPLLEKIVKSGTASRKMKEQALFILSQSPSPRAQQLIADIARGNANPGVQKEAIRYLGISGHHGQLLSEIYSSPNISTEAKKEVLEAFMISGDRNAVVNAARTETNPQLREKAIQMLGVMGARSELHSMYANETSRENRDRIIDALFVAGDSAKIADLAQNEKDPKLRAEAIRKLGLMGGKTAQLLLSFYATGDANVKDAVLDGLFVQGNAKALIGLARKETDRRMKKEILQKLSVMRDEDAVAYMLEILEE